MLRMLFMADHESESVQRFSLEALQNMKLPKIPEKLRKVLSINWVGKGNAPATSAVGALVDKQGNPLATISLIYRRYIHEETFPFKHVEREFKIFSEVAEEMN